MSGYREIVAVAPTGPETAEILKVTELTAKRFGSSVEFVHAEPAAIYMPRAVAEADTDIDLARRVIANDERQRAEIRVTVDRELEVWRAETDVPAHLTRLAGSPEPAIWNHMLTADLAVLPRPGSIPNLDVETVLLEAGRPAILALGHPGENMGERIAVFWRCTPMTSHAVAAALPFLRGAKAVALVAAYTEGDDPDPSLERAEDWLKRHRVPVEVVRARNIDGSVGDTLIGAAGDFDADMIVMGAYGHSRLREWALGSVTRHVLRYAERPVLACH